MDKRIKWGIVALIGIGLIGLAVHTFVPRTNDELAEVEQQKPTATKKTTLNVNAQIICIDLVYAATDDPGQAHLLKRIESRNGVLTIEAAAELGYGSREYELVEV